MAVDRVKPLKIETATDGTQTDPFPVEANPTQDYLASKGIAFENNDNRLIDLDGSGNLQFKDFTETVYVALWKLRRAIYEIFDPTGSDLVSTNTEAAIKEVNLKVATSASPGFGYGRSGNSPTGTWLQCESVPSNAVGRYIYINSPVVKSVFVGNEDVGTFTLGIYQHDGNLVNSTLLGSVTVTAALGGAFAVNWSATTGKYIGIQITSGTVKNIVCGLELSGTS